MNRRRMLHRVRSPRVTHHRIRNPMQEAPPNPSHHPLMTREQANSRPLTARPIRHLPGLASVPARAVRPNPHLRDRVYFSQLKVLPNRHPKNQEHQAASKEVRPIQHLPSQHRPWAQAEHPSPKQKPLHPTLVPHLQSPRKYFPLQDPRGRFCRLTGFSR
jgi:hypothetical protein